MDFASYGLAKNWLLLQVAIKSSGWNHFNTLVILDSKNFWKILTTNVGSGMIYITRKINVTVNKI